jgi:tetratricopeptide (TPR) repeat protein
LGKIYASQFQDYERAVVEYQHVVLGKGYSDQEKAQAKLETGNAYYNLGNFQQARIEYEGLKQLYPDSLEGKRAILQLANTYDADSDYENALALYKQMAALDVKELAILEQFGVASCHEEMGHYEEALNMFNTILDKYPSRKVVEIRIERLTQRLHEVKSNH